MKKTLTLFLILFLTGCSTKYEININEDLSVTEKITAIEDISFFEIYPNSSKKRVIDFIYESREDELKEAGYKYSYYENEKIEDNYEYGGVLTNNYNTVEEFAKSSLPYTQFWDEIRYTKENNIITIETIGDFYGYVEQDPDKFLVENAEIIINLPHNIIETNGICSKNNGENSCVWKFDKDTKNFQLKISFEIKEKEEIKSAGKIINETMKVIKWPLIIVIVTILILIITIFIVKMIQRNKI